MMNISRPFHGPPHYPLCGLEQFPLQVQLLLHPLFPRVHQQLALPLPPLQVQLVFLHGLLAPTVAWCASPMVHFGWVSMLNSFCFTSCCTVRRSGGRVVRLSADDRNAYWSEDIYQVFLVLPFTMIPADEQAMIPPVFFLSTTIATTPRGWVAIRLSTKSVTTDPIVTSSAVSLTDLLWRSIIFSPWFIWCIFFRRFLPHCIIFSFIHSLQWQIHRSHNFRGIGLASASWTPHLFI